MKSFVDQTLCIAFLVYACPPVRMMFTILMKKEKQRLLKK